METRICKITGKEFQITAEYKGLLDKIWAPLPEICFEERMRNLLAFWPSVGKWYKRKCDFSWETIVTIYPPDARFPVYKKKYFESDARMPARCDIDRNKPFFTQLQELQEKIPRPHQTGERNSNCEFCDDVWNSKDCYLAISMKKCEKLFYGYRNIWSDKCFDLVFGFDCQLCYSCTYCFNCYECFWSVNSRNCQHSYFFYDCQNCEHCFLCRNLRWKKHCIRNQQYSKEEYEKLIERFRLHSRKNVNNLKEEFKKIMREDAFHLNIQNFQTENCTGTFLERCKECENCFFIQDSEKNCNAIRWLTNKYCVDCSGMLECERCYLSNQISRCYNLWYSSCCASCRDSFYLDSCMDCSYCFACIGLKRKQYCIFNKQYTKSEYETLIVKLQEKIKAEWITALFLPYSMMYTGFNTTMARFYTPDTKDGILKRWGYREEGNEIQIQGEGYDLPDSILDTLDDISDKAIICTKTGQKFNFAKQYVDFCKKYKIALPTVTHMERIEENFTFCSSITPMEGKSAISWKPLVHYYNPVLWFQKIISKEEYDKLIY